jgi:hypothetical protein
VKVFNEDLYFFGISFLYFLHCEKVVTTAAVFKKNDIDLPDALFQQGSVFEVDV